MLDLESGPLGPTLVFTSCVTLAKSPLLVSTSLQYNENSEPCLPFRFRRGSRNKMGARASVQIVVFTALGNGFQIITPDLVLGP